MPILPKQQPPYYEKSTQIKIYKAILHQTGANAPIASIISNNIGNIVWTRTGVGGYAATLSNAFPIDQTWMTLQAVNGATIVPIGFLPSVNQIQYFTYTIGTGFTDGSIICIEINTITE